MAIIEGIACSPSINQLLQEVERFIAPSRVSFRSIADLGEAPEALRGARAICVPDENAIYINSSRPDTDEHSIAHELGHLLVAARGKVSIEALPGVPMDAAYERVGEAANRLEHIAFEDDLRAAGFDTAPGHRRRIDQDLLILTNELSDGLDGSALGVIVPRAIRYAEARHCAAPVDFRYLAARLRAGLPHAAELGRRLAAAVSPSQLRTLSGFRTVLVKWLRLIDDYLRGRGLLDGVGMMEVASVYPVVLSPAELASPSSDHVEFSTQSGHAGSCRIRVRLLRDGSFWRCFTMRLDRPGEDAVRSLIGNWSARPLREVIDKLPLPYIEK
jgi:hypothetical protein